MILLIRLCCDAAGKSADSFFFLTTLIERRQRRAEASGEPFEDPRERSRFHIDHRPRTIAEVLRQARQRRRLDRFDECSNQAAQT